MAGIRSTDQRTAMRYSIRGLLNRPSLSIKTPKAHLRCIPCYVLLCFGLFWLLTLRQEKSLFVVLDGGLFGRQLLSINLSDSISSIAQRRDSI